MRANHYVPTRQKNKQLREREHLSPPEIDKLMAAAKSIGRHGIRDSTMILISYRHGLRISELVTLKWSQIDLEQGYVHILRRKNGIDATHPLFGSELRALRKVQKDYPSTDYVFISERKAPVTEHVFRKVLKRAGEIADLNVKVHPHMLRHSTGFKLANEGRDTRSIQHYLGHKNIQHTVRYTELAVTRFKNFWSD